MTPEPQRGGGAPFTRRGRSLRRPAGRAGMLVALALTLAGCLASPPFDLRRSDDSSLTPSQRAWIAPAPGVQLTGAERRLLERGRESRAAGRHAEADAAFAELIDAGIPHGFFEMGLAHEQGDGVHRDLGLAARHYASAASRESDIRALAQYRLGRLYLDGDGVPQDAGLATRLLEEAGRGGHPPALARLGRRLIDPEAPPTDRERGYALLAEAAETGDVDAMLTLAHARAEGAIATGTDWRARAVAELQRRAAGGPGDPNGLGPAAPLGVGLLLGGPGGPRADRMRGRLAAARPGGHQGGGDIEARCHRWGPRSPTWGTRRPGGRPTTPCAALRAPCARSADGRGQAPRGPRARGWGPPYLEGHPWPGQRARGGRRLPDRGGPAPPGAAIRARGMNPRGSAPATYP